MPKISATRTALLALKVQIELAKQGHELLQEKRAVLMKELLRVADAVVQGSEVLQEVATEAAYALARAEATAGTEAVRGAALATHADLPLQVETVTLMGLKVPRIERKRVSRSMLARGYAITDMSLTIDEAASAFEGEVDSIIEQAEIELRLTRLAAEVQRTSRRLNALEYALIPRLEAERNRIEMALDERERADHARLKMVRRILERKRAMARKGPNA